MGNDKRSGRIFTDGQSPQELRTGMMLLDSYTIIQMEL